MTTTNATNRANTGNLRATGVGLFSLGMPIAALGAWAWAMGPTVDAVLVIACGVAIAALGVLQIVQPGALVDDFPAGGPMQTRTGDHGASTHADPLLHVA